MKQFDHAEGPTPELESSKPKGRHTKGHFSTPRASSKRRRRSRPPFYKRTPFKIFCIILCCVCFSLGAYLGILYNEAKELKRLSQIVQENTTVPSTEPSLPSTCETTADPTTMPTLTEPAETQPDRTILPQYLELSQKNPELFGWIKIDGTRIDYPVMHTPDDPEKYLHTDFKEESSYAGIPFLDASCSETSDNLLIYGHNMLDGSMFRSLLKYESKTFWESHPVIEFDTLYETQKYEVLSAFYDRVYYKTEDVFKFYQFIDAENEEEYNDAVAHFKEKQLYETGVEAAYGDQLITLVTCAYHTDNGRFVVVARKIQD